MAKTFFSIETHLQVQDFLGVAVDSVPPEVQRIAAALSRNETSSFSIIPAGYTYIGQMISHDIVPPTSVANHPRVVEPKLQLDSVYGPENDRQFQQDGKFEPGQNPWDLRRNGTHRAVLVEPRNDENPIIAQLHVFWQKFHNSLITKGYAANGEEARFILVQLFQLMVIEDYLRRILDPLVYESYFDRGERHLGLTRNTIPPEFAHAAFRFGHSMVRNSYQMNEPPADRPWLREPRLEDLFLRSGPIPRKFRIEWEFFFPTKKGDTSQRANPINTFISPMMARIPIDQGETANITQLNLLAGIKSGLPKGAAMVYQLLQGFDGFSIPPQSLALRPVGNLQLRALGEPITDLPLWPYLLLEAEIQQNGDRLGTLGSMIVAETLQNCIRLARPSILNRGQHDFMETCVQLGMLGEKLEEIVFQGKVRCSRRPGFEMRHILELLD